MPLLAPVTSATTPVRSPMSAKSSWWSDRLRKAVAALPFPVPQALNVTCSIGVACSSHVAPDELLRRADEALYEAKSQGRNRVATSS